MLDLSSLLFCKVHPFLHHPGCQEFQTHVCNFNFLKTSKVNGENIIENRVIIDAVHGSSGSSVREMKRKKKRELPKYLFVNLVSGERDPPSMRFRETTQSLTMKNSNSHFQERTILGSHSDLNRTLSKPFWKPQNPPILHWFHSFTFIHFPTFSIPKRMIYCAYSIGEDEATACRLRAILDPRSSFLLSDCDSFLDPQSQYRLVFPSVKQRFVRSIH